MKVTTFYSYKGGLGRSLLLSHCAKSMANDGKSIVAIDLDLEAPGLPYKLGFDRRSEMGPGLVGLLRRFLDGKPPPESLRDWARPVPGHERLSILPAGPLAAATYWNDLAAIEWDQLFRGPDPQGVRFFAWLSESIERDLAPDHLFVDARTGVTAMGGAAVSLLADQVIALVGTSPEGLHGTREVLRAITVAPRLAGKDPVRIGIVLSRIPGQLLADEVQSIRKAVRDQLQEEADSLLATVAVEMPLVVRSEPSLERDERSAERIGRLRVHEDYQAVISWIEGSPATLASEASYLSSDSSLGVLRDQIRLQRDLAERDPAASLPDLASSLGGLASRLNQGGRRSDAVVVAEEAIGLWRRLVSDSPGRFRPALAAALNNLGIMLRDAGRVVESLAPSQEAASIYRQLASEFPGEFSALGLGAALHNLAHTLSDMDRRGEAVAAAEEAVAVYGQFEGREPLMVRHLADAVSNLSVLLAEDSRLEEALRRAREAVALNERLVASGHEQSVSHLALTLAQLGNRLHEVGHLPDAVLVTEQSVSLLRAAGLGGSAGSQLILTVSLLGLATKLDASGRLDEAILVSEEALSLLMRMPSNEVHAMGGLFASAWSDYRDRCRRVGRPPRISPSDPPAE